MVPARPTLVHCTNGYPLFGEDCQHVLAGLMETVPKVRAAVAGGGTLGLGLYLPAKAGRELLHLRALESFLGWIESFGAVVRTLNAFPFERFHAEGNPRGAYTPSWAEPGRLEQVEDLAAILVEALPEGVTEASISTLPVGWGGGGVDHAAAAANLRAAATKLERLRAETGVRVTLDLEPEPGCALHDSASAVAFFDRWLADAAVREHVGVCHDVCHAAVTFEGQAGALGRYRDAGVRVNKVQLSSAPDADFAGLDAAAAREAVDRLRSLPGDRSLRQTFVRGGQSYDDLEEALAAHPRPGGRWRVHHHLPLTLERFGPIGTTRDAVGEALADLAAHGETPILETETYTWSALPLSLRAPSLAEGLAGELRWAEAEIARAWPS